MNKRFLKKIINNFTEKVYKETPLLFLTEPADFGISKNESDKVYIKSNLHCSNHYLLRVPYKSVCREI